MDKIWDRQSFEVGTEHKSNAKEYKKSVNVQHETRIGEQRALNLDM